MFRLDAPQVADIIEALEGALYSVKVVIMLFPNTSIH